MLLIWRYENILARKLFEQGCGFAEIGCQDIDRIAGDPRRKINRLVSPGVKSDQHATPLVTKVFNRVSVSLRDVTDVASVQLLRSEEHTSELQSRFDLVCRLLLEKKNKIK